MKSHWKSIFLVLYGFFFILVLSGCGPNAKTSYDPDTKEYTEKLYAYDDDPENPKKNPDRITTGPRDEKGMWHGKIRIEVPHHELYVISDYSHGARDGATHYYDRVSGEKLGSEIYIEDKLAYREGKHIDFPSRYSSAQVIGQELNSNSIYNNIASRQPWFIFWMMNHYSQNPSEEIKSIFNEVESHIAAKAPAHHNEFEAAFDEAASSSIRLFSEISDNYSTILIIEEYTAAKLSPLRLAFLNNYRNGMLMPTYEILKNSYPDYLLRLKIYGAAATDVQRYTDEIDARLKTLDPLDPNDPMFTIHLDKYLEDEYIDVLLNYKSLSYSNEIAATIAALQSDGKTIRKTVNPLRQAAMRVYFDESAVVALSAVYVAFFERAADADGLAYWTAQAGSGAVDFDLLRQLTNGFAQHPSYTSIYGGLSDSAFVDAIYLNIGGAPADADGKAYWLTQLDDGMTRPDFIAQFILDLLSYREATLYQLVIDGILTPEERDNALLRKNRLTNKAVVGLTFTNTLGNASNLRPETDPLDPASLAKDPAYRASVKIIADVTEEIATREVALDYLATQPTIEMINDR